MIPIHFPGRKWAFIFAGGLVALMANLAVQTPSVRAETAVKPRPAATGELLPTGKRITPKALPGAIFETLNPNLKALPDFGAGQASAMAVSADGNTLAVLTSGYNRNYGMDGKAIEELSNEYVFLYDISGPLPVKQQVIKVPNTFLGLAWHPLDKRFFVSGGVDDVIYDYRLKEGAYALAATVPLGHDKGVGVANTKPEAAGIAISPDGNVALVTNYQNDSVSLIDLTSDTVVSETDLRPGIVDPSKSGAPGGTYPNAVAFVSGTKAYVASQRDRELIAVKITGYNIAVTNRSKLDGQPSAIAVSPEGTRAYVALDNTDQVSVIDTGDDTQIEKIWAAAPIALWRNPQGLRGANTNALAISADGKLLLASNGGLNAVALIALGDLARDPQSAEYATNAGENDKQTGADADAQEETGAGSSVVGLLPTGWYPTAVAVRPDNARIYVANGKSNAGPNPLGCRDTLKTDRSALDACRSQNQYVWQLEKAGLLTMPMPSGQQVADMSWQVAANNNFPIVADHGRNAQTMAFLRSKIDHVIYVVKENRTYDQVLGDLEVGNGDPSLTLLPEPISPNHHALARNFVTLDAFYDSGESSNTGWNWTTAARTTDFTERTAPVNYASRGLQYDWEGTNRGINVALASPTAREAANPAAPSDVNIMAGTADVAAPDAPRSADAGMVGTGYLWDAALRAGLSVRNYGFYGDLSRYFNKNDPSYLPADLREPYKNQTQVFFPSNRSLAPHTDVYFRGYDQKYPDYWRYKEWEREFDGYVRSGALPNLSLVRFNHDHFGSFGDAIDGVDTVETQMADNDYALGMLVEKVANSPFANSTLIFVVEDDAQNGADHVDPHRSIAFVAGPYVRQNAIISRPYTTASMLRTIEDVLGLPPLGLNDGLTEPMSAVFDPDQWRWSFKASVPQVLRGTKLPLPEKNAASDQPGRAEDCFARPARSSAYWVRVMEGQNFAGEDRLDTARFNQALWEGLRGKSRPQMEEKREDLSKNRGPLLEKFRAESSCR